MGFSSSLFSSLAVQSKLSYSAHSVRLVSSPDPFLRARQNVRVEGLGTRLAHDIESIGAR